MTDTDQLTTSYSDITRHDFCKRSWWLGSFLGLRLKRQAQTGPLPFGSRIHLVLEAAEKSDGWERIGQMWNKAMDREFDVLKMTGGFEKDLVKESKMGLAMLEAFADWREETHQAAKWKVIGVETKYGQEIDLELPDGRTVKVLFRGKLDILQQRQSDGAIVIVDYKTAANLAEVTISNQEDSSQGPMYFMLVQMTEPDKFYWGVSYILLRKVAHGPTSKPPYFKRLDVPITPAKLAAHRTNLMAKATDLIITQERLEAGVNPAVAAPYSVGWWCNSCPFKAPCKQMQRGNPLGAQDMLDEQYVLGDIWERYADDEERLQELL